MKIISLQWKLVIGLIVILIIVINLILWTLSFWDKQHSKSYGQNVENVVIDTLSRIYEFQQDFKRDKIVDNNNNGIGEYATTYELVEYMREKKDNACLYALYKEDLIMRSATYHKIILPLEVALREKTWVGLAIPDPHTGIGYKRTYYLDERGIIFFTPEDLSGKISDEQWLLNEVFGGEPFKSPLDTSMWKILDHSIEQCRQTHPWPTDNKPDKPKEPDKSNENNK
jgi:hypothetical protein